MRVPGGSPIQRARRRTAVIAAVAVVFALIVLGTASGFYTDLLWFKETGFQDVFWTQLRTKVALGAAFGAIFAAVLLLNLWIAQKITSPSHVFRLRDQMIERYRMLLRPYVRRIVVGGSILFGLFAGSGATAQWRNWLLFRNAQSFNETDPVFMKDLGFYVFKLPFHRFMFTWGFSSLLVITIIVGITHYLMGGIRSEGSPRVAPHVKAHLSVLLGLIVCLKAWGYRLDQFNLLYSLRGGQVTGASYTDVNAQLPALRLLVVIALVCGVLFLVNIRFRGWVLPAAGIGILALTSIIVGGIYPATVQRLRVNPQEGEREAPFIARNIEATRKAFNLNAITESELPADARVTPAGLTENASTIENIRLWNPDLLADAYTQIQRLTSYYEFLEVDVDRYKIGGTTRQVMLAAREVDPSGLDSRARTWVNSHLRYTHGYGVVASRVDRATAEGQPDFLIRDTPPKGVAGAPPITEPRIYFGEKEAQRFVIVNSSTAEIDYPTSQTNVAESNYDGKGGIPLKGFFRRLAFAWRFRDVNVLISSAVRPGSKIMFRRNVADRVEQVAPFIQLDSDPYITIANGRLIWIVDGYTTTGNYPYAQRINLSELTATLRGRANYIRNSVKATVDALDGTITLYVWDPADPIIKAWSAVFPGLLKDAKDMPSSIREHVRYPEDLFLIQADRYATYHITDPQDFYSKNDVWQVPTAPWVSVNAQMPPYYVLMRLPGEKTAEFLLMLPFRPFSRGDGTRSSRLNMTAWLAARSDPDRYGKLVSFVYGKSTTVDGPELVAARIANDQTVRQELARLDPKNERIERGDLLVIPIGEALLYVQPLYLRSTESPLPEFKRVVVVSGSQIRIAETLGEALRALFGAGVPSGVAPPTETTDVSDLIASALNHFAEADKALRAGDLSRYQREIDAAERDMQAAQKELGGSPSPSPSPSPTPTG